MKILLRNLVNLFARNKTAALLNIAGLTVAFASFMLIMMQVWYELGYDRCYPNANRIYGLCFQVPQSGDLGTVLPRPLAEKLLRSSAGIETGGCLSYQHGDPNVPFFRPERGPESAIAAGFSLVSRSWLDVFGFETLSGDLNAFSEPNAAIIPHSLAVKLFGSENPVGQTIAKSEGYREAAQFTIVAVYRDFPKNASLKNDVYTDLKERLLQDFNNCSTPYFVRVKQNADIRRIEQDLLPLVWNYAKTYDEDSTRSQRLRLVGLNDLYFFNETISQEGGNRNTTYSLLTVALLILLIAVINFINFTIAQAPARMRSINTQKVFGCRSRQLRINLIAEAVCLTAVSFLLAVLTVHALEETNLSSLITGGISPGDYPGLISISAGIALLTGFIAGIYPAFYITSLQPALALKGTFSVSRPGKKLRVVLIAVQFSISMILIIVALAVHIQNRHIRQFDIGLPRENIVTFDLGPLAGRSADPLIHKLKSNPDIADVTLSRTFIVSKSGTFCNRLYKNDEIDFRLMGVAPNFCSFMGMHLVEGRDFTETDQQRDAPALIFNRTAKKLYDITVPDWLEYSGEIVGIVEDYHDKPLHYSIEPIALIVYDRSSPLYCMYVKINNPDPGPAIAFIREAYRTLSPQRQVPDVKFMEEQLGNLYQKERNLSEMIFLFSLVSVSLAITGVFGVIHFETSSRRKEIALRKVYGSQTGEILRMFNKTYIRIVLICFAVAAPAAYIVVKRWLESFTYKTPIPSWIFLMAPAIVLIIVVAVITLRCYKTATDNPIKSIRTE